MEWEWRVCMRKDNKKKRRECRWVRESRENDGCLDSFFLPTLCFVQLCLCYSSLFHSHASVTLLLLRRYIKILYYTFFFSFLVKYYTILVAFFKELKCYHIISCLSNTTIISSYKCSSVYGPWTIEFMSQSSNIEFPILTILFCFIQYIFLTMIHLLLLLK